MKNNNGKAVPFQVSERAKKFMNKDDYFSKLIGIEKGRKRLTAKERKKLFDEFIKTDTSNIFRELNLD